MTSVIEATPVEMMSEDLASRVGAPTPVSAPGSGCSIMFVDGSLLASSENRKIDKWTVEVRSLDFEGKDESDGRRIILALATVPASVVSKLLLSSPATVAEVDTGYVKCAFCLQELHRTSVMHDPEGTYDLVLDIARANVSI